MIRLCGGCGAKAASHRWVLGTAKRRSDERGANDDVQEGLSLDIFSDLLELMKHHKMVWLAPLLLVLGLIGGLLLFAKSSGNAPFTYTLF